MNLRFIYIYEKRGAPLWNQAVSPPSIMSFDNNVEVLGDTSLVDTVITISYFTPTMNLLVGVGSFSLFGYFEFFLE